MTASEESIDPEFKEIAKTNFDACTEAYYHCNSQITLLVKTFRVDTSNMQGFNTSARFSIPQQASTQNFMPDTSCIKLPPCDTEILKGSYEQWPLFRDMFTAVYINHPKLTPIAKLYHLGNKREVKRVQ
ncbi:hypothetical protein CVS40_5809 [Lucilia cuprina]|nr:hypothetical protein CVS40_5809 [Lucilia cuprina]